MDPDKLQAEKGFLGLMTYTHSTSVLESMTLALAREIEPKGVKVNWVFPVAIRQLAWWNYASFFQTLWEELLTLQDQPQYGVQPYQTYIMWLVIYIDTSAWNCKGSSDINKNNRHNQISILISKVKKCFISWKIGIILMFLTFGCVLASVPIVHLCFLSHVLYVKKKVLAIFPSVRHYFPR